MAVQVLADPSPSPTPLTQIPAPCNDPGQAQRKGLRSCSDVISTLQANLKARVQLQVSGQSTGAGPSQVIGIYGGCEHGSASSTVCQDGQGGSAVGGAVCNPVPGLLNNQTAETDTNHFGQSCGQWAYPRASLHGHTCTLSMDYRHPFHTAEEAWMRGAEVRGYDCHLTQVLNELTSRSLKLTSVGGVASPCAAIAAQVDQLVASAAQQKTTLDAGLEGATNVKETELCTSTESSSTSTNSDVAALRQSACQLKAVQQSLEAVFTQMAFCEVSYRLMNSYQAFLVSPDDKKTIDQEVMSIINGQRGNHSMCSAGYIQPRYIDYYKSRYMTRLNQVWNDAVCK